MRDKIVVQGYVATIDLGNRVRLQPLRLTQVWDQKTVWRHDQFQSNRRWLQRFEFDLLICDQRDAWPWDRQFP